MKRLHIHMGVENLRQSIDFYTALFGAEPIKVKPDYAKWMLDDPHVNFAISTRSGSKGVDHLGIQLDDNEQVAKARAALEDAKIATHDDGEAVCCYARSEKSWVTDPNDVAWEVYHTMEDANVFNDKASQSESESCCAPTPKAAPAASKCC